MKKSAIIDNDKENASRFNNLGSLISGSTMHIVQESQREDKSFRKRQDMLSDIQAMIIDYKKKAQYNNLVSGLDGASITTE